MLCLQYDENGTRKHSLIIWGATFKSYLTFLLQNRALQIINNAQWVEKITPLFDFDKNKLPNFFNDYFCKTSQVHTRFTRST